MPKNVIVGDHQRMTNPSQKTGVWFDHANCYAFDPACFVNMTAKGDRGLGIIK